MKIKNYLLVSCFFIFYNCEKDFLNVVPDNIATIDLAFNNRATAERFLSTCYTYIPEHAHAEQNFSLVAGDEIWYYAENDFSWISLNLMPYASAISSRSKYSL